MKKSTLFFDSYDEKRISLERGGLCMPRSVAEGGVLVEFVWNVFWIEKVLIPREMKEY